MDTYNTIRIFNLYHCEKWPYQFQYNVYVQFFLFWFYTLCSFPELRNSAPFLPTPFSEVVSSILIQLNYFVTARVPSWDSLDLLNDFFNLHTLRFALWTVGFGKCIVSWIHTVSYRRISPPKKIVCASHIQSPLGSASTSWQPPIFSPSLLRPGDWSSPFIPMAFPSASPTKKTFANIQVQSDCGELT